MATLRGSMGLFNPTYSVFVRPACICVGLIILSLREARSGRSPDSEVEIDDLQFQLRQLLFDCGCLMGGQSLKRWGALHDPFVTHRPAAKLLHRRSSAGNGPIPARVVGIAAHTCQDARAHQHLTDLIHPNFKVPVFVGLHRSREYRLRHRVQHRPFENKTTGAEQAHVDPQRRISWQKPRLTRWEAGQRGRKARGSRLTILEPVLAVRYDGARRRELAKEIEFGAQLASKPHIIRIEEGDVIAAGVSYTAVSRGGRAGVLLTIIFDAGIPCGQGPRIIRGPIVDDDYLHLSMILREHAVQRISQKRRPIPGWDHYRDERRIHASRCSTINSPARWAWASGRG